MLNTFLYLHWVTIERGLMRSRTSDRRKLRMQSRQSKFSECDLGPNDQFNFGYERSSNHLEGRQITTKYEFNFRCFRTL
jgi:hypothetical protein